MSADLSRPDNSQLDNYSLEDRYLRDSGRVFLTGTQALVRIPLMQAALDRKLGLKTAGMVSGYRGSPLGAYDQALWQAKNYLDESRIDFVPAINEDLAATIMLGTQQVETDDDRQVDGVFGIWYGKGPGVDRAGDALKHGTTYGSSPHGGVLVVAGDDHGCVSSSMPHQSDVAFMSFFMPTINPANVAEYLDFGLWGIALSRYSGCWVGFKAVSETVESAASVELPPLPEFVTPDDFTPPETGLHYRWPDLPGPQLETRIEHKLAAVQAFARANPIDRCLFNNAEARFGIVTTGKGHLDLLEALDLLGIDEHGAREMGLDIYKVGLVWPIERRGMLNFVHSKEEVLVIEEKRGIIESQIKEAMSEPDRPGEVLITGKQDELGRPLIPYVGELSPKLVAGFLAARLGRFFGEDYNERLMAINSMSNAQDPGGVKRLPYFCSGCPHNTSTKVPEGSKALAGIGCHFMASWMGRNTESLIQMGGEGVNWIGKSRYTGNPHVFQNLGEGTYFHSGSMAIRQAVAAGINITYKILFNDAVAMTGGQPVDGQITVPMIAQQVAAEGVRRVVVLSDEPEKYDGHKKLFPDDVTFHDRSELDKVQRELRDISGCTVLIYDQTCAAEKRRRRKRNLYPDPAKRAFINHHVCEGCGDCSVQSNCLSVVPRQTELGRKRKIDQSSCNKDYSCVNGFCPSFVTIEGGQLRKSRGMDTGSVLTGKLANIPEPARPELTGSYDVLVGGVGGTGVVTVGQLITMAAHLEAKGTSVLDFTGFAQKGGTVLSYVRMAPSPDKLHQVRISHGQADALIACDLVVASSQKALSVLRPDHTRVVANEAELPTGDYVLFRDADMKSEKRLDLIRDAVGDHNFARLDANGIAEKLMGDTVFSNVMMLGFAWQRGLLPLSQAALMKAIELNGVAVERNKEAFGWGRVAATDVKVITDLLTTGQARVEEVKAEPSLDELINIRHKHLVNYQSRRWADRYTTLVKQVREAEEKLGETNNLLTRAVAQQLYRFMAFKDEYEVARLFAETDFMKEVNNTFEGDFKVHFHLAPPIMNRGTDAQGRPRKRQFGPWMFRVFKLLAKFRVLRGTPVDPFSYSADRKMDRAQLKEYQQLVERIVSELDASNYDTFLQLAELGSEIRGYGPVREQAAEAVQEKHSQLIKALNTGRPTLIRTSQADHKEADHV
ncbi:indolepyruvate ferredoxin oxidoreductase family protein [Marinobacter sp. 2_MG-2023]|uniref:indolepyruvate ferredoxin oxidoreductase family protein n=1 Tax=Marinobacter sp. 2_MG-2023 TaxID=3062679 RepID=UPI0026E2C124|nr:indolepyruvate ferredoxin oxidoreductase family protein [Marinobacter sp. 2_MG-2023]MDO6440726.1 indolepyruvate ferredoxin oxidoreductase family protein [Marinobacter sp. 2_MG-2023]